MLQRPVVQDELDELARDLIHESHEFDGLEQRAAPRSPFVSGVTVTFSAQEREVIGFSRDISAVGLGIITQNEIPLGTKATLGVDRIDGSTVRVLSVCQWCRPFGKNWYASGWEFVTLLGTRRF